MNDNNERWIQPLAQFMCRVISGNRVEIPKLIRTQLHINPNDVLEIAYVDIANDECDVTVYHTTVGERGRIPTQKYRTDGNAPIVGTELLMGVLSVYHSRSTDMVVMFDQP